MRFGQHVAVDDQVAQDAVPCRVAVSGLSKLSASAFKSDFDVHVVDDFQGLAYRVVAERRHVEHYHVEAAYLGGLGDGDVLAGVVGVFAVNAHVFLHSRLPDGGVALHGGGRQDVDASQGPATFFFDFYADRCAFRNGDVSVLER